MVLELSHCLYWICQVTFTYPFNTTLVLRLMSPCLTAKFHQKHKEVGMTSQKTARGFNVKFSPAVASLPAWSLSLMLWPKTNVPPVCPSAWVASFTTLIFQATNAQSSGARDNLSFVTEQRQMEDFSSRCKGGFTTASNYRQDGECGTKQVWATCTFGCLLIQR